MGHPVQNLIHHRRETAATLYDGVGSVKGHVEFASRWRLATLYDGVGSVKGHVEFASRWRLVLSSPRRIFSLSFISTKARFVNPAVETGSTNHLFGLPLRGTMIRSSDAAITRGSKAPNQPSDELAFIRVAPGLPCLRTSCA